MSKFFTKQKSGDAALALQDMRGLESVGSPYMRDTRLGQTSEKRGAFRETWKVGSGDRFMNNGWITKDGTDSLIGVTSKNAGAKFSVGKDLYFGPTEPPDAEGFKLMWYVGRDTYAYIKSDEVLTYQNYPAGVTTDARSVPVFNGVAVLGLQNGRRSAPHITTVITTTYTSIFDDVFGRFTGAGFDKFDDVSDTTRIGPVIVEPLDVVGGVKTLVSWPQYIGVNDQFGFARSDWLFTTMTKDGVGVIRAMPRLSFWSHAQYARWKIVVITPTEWIAFSCVYMDTRVEDPDDNNSDYAGWMIYYRSHDAGVSWNIFQDDNTVMGLTGKLNANLPSQYPLYFGTHTKPPFFAIEDTIHARNLAVLHATYHLQCCVVTPKILLLSFPYYGYGPQPLVTNFGHNYNRLTGTSDLVFLSRLLRSTDAGATWTELATPTLIESVTTWPTLSHQYYLFRDITYCGNGVVIAKLRAGAQDGYSESVPPYPFIGELVWNLVRSMDYGATWACVPKNGFPAAMGTDPAKIGRFTLLKKATFNGNGQDQATIATTVWGGDGYYLCVSRDNGDTWTLGPLLAKSERFNPMDRTSVLTPGGGGPTVHNWVMRFLEYTGDRESPAPPPESLATPWRFNSNMTWVEE